MQVLNMLREGTRLSWRALATELGVSYRKLTRWRAGLLPEPEELDSIKHDGARELLSGVARRAYDHPSAHARADSLLEIYKRHFATIQASETLKLPASYMVEIAGPRVEFPNARLRTEFLARLQGPPLAPVQTSPGPTLTPTSDGFDLQARPIPDSERSDAGQITLHKRLRVMADRLQMAMPGISNSHPALAAEFEDYRAFLSADLAALNVTGLWAVGSGLGEHVRALNQPGNGVMTPGLEPDIVAGLRNLLTSHAAFIVGFTEGQELLERVAKSREAAEADPNLAGKTQSVLTPMRDQPHLLAVKAQLIVRALVRGFAAAPTVAFDLITSSTEMARNSVYAFIKVLHPVLIAGETANLALILAGYDNPEVLKAAAEFLRDNHESIVALFASEPNVAAWLGWALQHMLDVPE